MYYICSPTYAETSHVVEVDKNPPLLGAQTDSVEIIAKLKKLAEEELEIVFLYWAKESDYVNYSEEYGKRIRIEFLRFISLRFFTKKLIFPPPAIDEFWHMFILHSEEYVAFCNRQFGEYLHHKPYSTIPADEYREGAKGKFTIDLVTKIYPDRSEDIWEVSFECAM